VETALIGATAKSWEVDKGLYRRFVKAYEFAPYKPSEIATLVILLGRERGITVDPDAAALKANHCDGSPGEASTLLKNIASYYDTDVPSHLTLDIARDALPRFGRSQSTEYSPDDNNRERIPEQVRIEVWRRDDGKCVRCGSRVKLEFDHIVPVSRGGGNTARNIELLCEKCNRAKSNHIE
jgi:HNH endonuclease